MCLLRSGVRGFGFWVPGSVTTLTMPVISTTAIWECVAHRTIAVRGSYLVVSEVFLP